MARAIDCLVNVDMGDQAARVDDPGQGGLLQGRRVLPVQPGAAGLLDDMDANGVERAILLTQVKATEDRAQRFVAARPDRFALGVGGFNLLRPMKTSGRSSRSWRDNPVAYASRRAQLLGRRHVPAQRRRLLPALHQVLRARPAAVPEHRHPRPAHPGRGPEPDPPRSRLRAVPRAQAVHDPRRRPLVGHGHPPHAQVREPAADDLGVVPKRLPESLLHYMSTRGKDRIMFASDYPVLSMERCLGEVAELPLTDEVRTAWLVGNAKAYSSASRTPLPERTRWNVSVHYRTVALSKWQVQSWTSSQWMRTTTTTSRWMRSPATSTRSSRPGGCTRSRTASGSSS